MSYSHYKVLKVFPPKEFLGCGRSRHFDKSRKSPSTKSTGMIMGRAENMDIL